MASNRQTGKDRWSRIPKDYFKKSDWIQKAKLRLSWLALIVALGWFAVGFDWTGGKSSGSDGNSLRANHGVLAKVHATWDNKCEACHVPFEPINGQALFSSKTTIERSSDRLCQSCHQGTAHHETTLASEDQSCASCHRDHQGRDFSMVRLNDRDCTGCHGSLKDHTATAKKPSGSRDYESNVTRFDTNHPPFRPEAAALVNGKLEDRSKLKFNHSLHMKKGIVRKDEETAYTIEKIPVVAERARYQKSGTLKDPVQLDCASCHVFDASELNAATNPAIGSAPLPARASGRYYLPINYETQCRACHALTFEPKTGLSDLEVPHGVQPDQVIAFLRRVYAEKAVQDPTLLSRKVVTSPLPGKRPTDSTTEQLLNESVSKASKFLFENKTSCRECHAIENDTQGNPVKVEPTRVPEVWFTHAKFNHTPHKAVSCRECHAGSYATEVDGVTPSKLASTKNTDVLIPAIDNCIQCHSPAKTAGGWFAAKQSGSSTGGASYDCTECHRYHNGDSIKQGLGALARDSAQERSIADFLTAKDLQPIKPSKKD